MSGTGRAVSGIANYICLFLTFLLVTERASALPLPKAPAPSPANEPTVRVRLNTIESAFTVSGMDLRYVGGQNPPAPYQALRVRARRLPGAFPGAFSEWTIEDRDRGTTIARIRARSFEISGRGLRLNLKPIPGRLSLLPRGRKLEVIAEIDLEAYVRGVLPAEMPKGWPLEALKAQAVAARTFALYRKGARRDALAYDLEATVMDQMYLFPDETAGLEKVERAVRETRDMVLLSPSERPAPLAAYFHADCGGRTEDAQMVWGSPGAGTTIDGGCPLNPLAKWRVALTFDDLARRLRPLAGKPASLALSGLAVAGRTPSGRVSQVRLAWNDGTSDEVSAHDFRMAIGHERLKSTNFDLEVAAGGKSAWFRGKGFGHGVGLCQWGARALASGGADFRQILRHYYPQSTMATTAAFRGTAADRPVALNR